FQHITGIPHSPTGQAIIERAHQTLKSLLLKQKEGETGQSPTEHLAKVLYVLNYLQLVGDRDDPPMIIHSSVLKSGIDKNNEKNLVQYKDLKSGEWKGP
ncbi:POK25 protein, partial [Herpetotheres cachinnans]|nr:POK25 protein [Herpetotheres cachinnans]